MNTTTQIKDEFDFDYSSPESTARFHAFCEALVLIDSKAIEKGIPIEKIDVASPETFKAVQNFIENKLNKEFNANPVAFEAQGAFVEDDEETEPEIDDAAFFRGEKEEDFAAFYKAV